MEALLLVAAAAGVLAIALRLAASLLRVGVRAVETTAESGLAEVSERRGDVTGFLERRETAAALRRARRREMLASAGWMLLLVLPVAVGLGRAGYAAAALLWLLPRRPVLGRGRGRGPG
jgi:hypothetical protein